MDLLRRILNVLSVVILALSAVGLAQFMLSDAPRNRVPFAFVGLFVALPALMHCGNMFLSWKTSGNAPSATSSIVGLAFSAISLFVWFVAGATVLEFAALRWSEPARVWPLVALAAGTLVLLSSGSINLVHFARVLQGANRRGDEA